MPNPFSPSCLRLASRQHAALLTDAAAAGSCRGRLLGSVQKSKKVGERKKRKKNTRCLSAFQSCTKCWRQLIRAQGTRSIRCESARGEKVGRTFAQWNRHRGPRAAALSAAEAAGCAGTRGCGTSGERQRSTEDCCNKPTLWSHICTKVK